MVKIQLMTVYDAFVALYNEGCFTKLNDRHCVIERHSHYIKSVLASNVFDRPQMPIFREYP